MLFDPIHHPVLGCHWHPMFHLVVTFCTGPKSKTQKYDYCKQKCHTIITLNLGRLGYF